MAEPVNDLTAETVAEFLYRRVFMIFAIAKIVHSDNGAALRSKLVELMAAKIGMQITRSLPHHSQGNPFAKRSVQRFQRVLLAYTSDTQKDWAVFVQAAQYTMNTIVNRSLNGSPFFVRFTRDPVIAHELEPTLTGPHAQNNRLKTTNFIEEQATK